MGRGNPHRLQGGQAHHFEGALGFDMVDQPVVGISSIRAAGIDTRRRRACLDQDASDEHLDFLRDQVGAAFRFGREAFGVKQSC